jgi:PAS domain S-box-containing protein
LNTEIDEEPDDGKVEEYVRRFGGGARFVQKILGSLSFPFSIINAKTYEVEISNKEGFAPGMKCYDFFRCCPKNSEGGDGDRFDCECIVDTVLAEKRPIVVKHFRNRDGGIMEVHASPIFDGEGNIVSVLNYSIDVTERKELEDNYKSFYDNLSDFFSLNEMIYNDKGVAVDWKVLKANPMYEKVFGVKIEGKYFSEIDSRIVKRLVGNFDKVLKEGKSRRQEIYLEEIDKYFEIFTYKFSKDRFVNMTRDVTREKKSLEETRKAEDRFFRILQNSQDLVYKYDIAKHRFDYVSESVFTILGFPLDEFVGMGFDALLERVHPNDIDKVKCVCDDLKGEVVFDIEYRFKCKDEIYKWLREKRVFFVDDSGKPVFIIGDISDITAEKVAEEEQRVLKKKISEIGNIGKKEGVNLTDREKVVLWGLCRYPLLNDGVLSEKLKIRRSTLTAIKNRLKERGLFNFYYIPNFNKLGCQFFSFVDGSVGKFSKDGVFDLNFAKSIPEIVLCNFQDKKFFGVLVSDRYVLLKKFLNDFVEKNGEALKFELKDLTFFYDLDKIEMIGFSDFVGSVFDIKIKNGKKIYTFGGDIVYGLNVNEKRVLHSMVKCPDDSSSKIAEKIWISKPTVIKIRKRLLDEGYLYPLVVPNVRKLGYHYVARISFDFDVDVPLEMLKKKIDPRVVFRIVGDKKIVMFMLFGSEEEYLAEISLIKDAHRREGIYLSVDSEIFALQKRHANILDLEPFVNDVLFGDEV